MNRYSKKVKRGKAGEWAAAAQLSMMGVQMVDRIHGSWAVAHFVNPSAGLAYVYPVEPVSGDHYGILPGGQRVLAETKAHNSKSLPWSALDWHQHGALDQNQALGGLSLVIWVKGHEVLVMDYALMLGCPDFRPRGFRQAMNHSARGSLTYQEALACLWPGWSGIIDYDPPEWLAGQYQGK